MRLTHRENLLALGDPTGMHKVDTEVVDELLLDDRLELPLVGELLGCDERDVPTVCVPRRDLERALLAATTDKLAQLRRFL